MPTNIKVKLDIEHWFYINQDDIKIINKIMDHIREDHLNGIMKLSFELIDTVLTRSNIDSDLKYNIYAWLSESEQSKRFITKGILLKRLTRLAQESLHIDLYRLLNTHALLKSYIKRREAEIKVGIVDTKPNERLESLEFLLGDDLPLGNYKDIIDYLTTNSSKLIDKIDNEITEKVNSDIPVGFETRTLANYMYVRGLMILSTKDKASIEDLVLMKSYLKRSLDAYRYSEDMVVYSDLSKEDRIRIRRLLPYKGNGKGENLKMATLASTEIFKSRIKPEEKVRWIEGIVETLSDCFNTEIEYANLSYGRFTDSEIDFVDTVSDSRYGILLFDFLCVDICQALLGSLEINDKLGYYGKPEHYDSILFNLMRELTSFISKVSPSLGYANLSVKDCTVDVPLDI